MKTSQLILATIAIALAASFAKADSPLGGRPTPEEVAIILFGGHDQNDDGALDSVELAQAIESLYDQRQWALIHRRDALLEQGLLSEEDTRDGIVTFSLLPEDGAAIMMKEGDTNHNQVLEAKELIASASSLRNLNLGLHTPFIRRS